MTSPVAVIGLTYAATDVQEADLGVFLELVRGLNELPAVRGMDVVVPGRRFRIPRNRIADTLILELRGMVRGEGADEDAQRADFRNKVDALQVLFSTERVPADLVATCEDLTVRTISCRPVNLAWSQILPSYAALSVELEAFEDWTVVGS